MGDRSNTAHYSMRYSADVLAGCVQVSGCLSPQISPAVRSE